MNENIETALFCCAIVIAAWVVMWLADLRVAYCKKYENHVDLDYVEYFKMSFHPPNEFHPEVWHIKTSFMEGGYKSNRSIKELCHDIRFCKLMQMF